MAEFNNRNRTKFEKINKVEKVAEVEEAIEESEVVEEVIEEPKPELKLGVVTDCIRLNVRETPNADAEVVCVLDALTELEVDESQSTDDFYKVITATSAEGYCMKQFIAI